MEDDTQGKPRQASAVRPELLPNFRQWEEEDRVAGHDYVIRKLDGQLYFEFSHVCNDIVADAGLGSDVTPHVLRHTAGTWLCQDGYRQSTAADMRGAGPRPSSGFAASGS